MKELQDLISERSTISTMNSPEPPAIAKGKENYKFKVGQTYQASGLGSLKENTPIKIIYRYKQHGYCYYVADNNQVHRQKDLK